MRILLALAALVLSFASVATVSAQQTVDPAALAQARVLVDKTGMLALMRQMATRSMQNMQRVLEAANPGKAEEVAKVMPFFAAEFEKRMPTLVDAVAGVYALHFSAEELAEINAFYDRAVGEKLITQLPLIISESQTIGGGIWQARGRRSTAHASPRIGKERPQTRPTKNLAIHHLGLVDV